MWKPREGNIYFYDPVAADAKDPPIGKPETGVLLRVVEKPGVESVPGTVFVEFLDHVYAGVVRTYSLIKTETRRLTCTCCGALTWGRQWHNLRTGYGLCDDCIGKPWILRTMDLALSSDEMDLALSSDEMERCFGRRRIHYGLQAWEGLGRIIW
jgi:hypothetical protein